MTKAESIVLAGGGTAGHINPMLAIADALKQTNPEISILTVGTEKGMEAEIVPAAGYDIAFIPRVPFPRRPDLAALKFPAQFLSSIRQAEALLKKAEANAVVGVGGYVCTPVYLAAHRLGIPIVVHEANAKVGLANKVGAKRAAFVGTAFANTPITRGQLVGMPMRRNVATLDRVALRRAARERLGLDPEKTTLVVTGGSLGALTLNKAVKENLAQIDRWGIQLLHITGRGKALKDESGNLLTAPSYVQTEFITSMEDVYAAADLLVVRSGAATVSEVAAVGLPAVFVPLPIGNGEQALNAASLVESGGGILVADADFTPDWFAHHIPELIGNAERLNSMAQASYAHGIRDAAETMAAHILKVAK